MNTNWEKEKKVLPNSLKQDKTKSEDWIIQNKMIC